MEEQRSRTASALGRARSGRGGSSAPRRRELRGPRPVTPPLSMGPAGRATSEAKPLPYAELPRRPLSRAVSSMSLTTR
jgi:hypothetical protein